VVNQSVAHKLWPGQNPIGRTAIAGGQQCEVIGVLADLRESNAEDEATAQMYLPATKQFGPEGSYLVLRSRIAPASLASSVMRVLREINSGQSASEFMPIQSLVDHATSSRRFFALLVGVFAGLGLLLASLGIFGVVSYSVTRQTREIGVKMALGASQSHVRREVISRTLRLALSGIGIGLVASVALGRLIASLLFRTAPTDPLTFAGMVVLLGGVALLAGYLPARRASKINPTVALRTN
jgi:ABC-type antimicrobial peptide transport system permease subunit